MKFAIAALPALLVTSAAMAADMTQPQVVAQGPGYTLSATGGVIAFGLPAQDTGVNFSGNGTFDPTTNVNALGLQGGLSAAIGLSSNQNYDLSLGISVFGAMASGTSTVNSNFTGQGTVVIPGYTTPTGTIQLNAGAGSARSQITGAGGLNSDTNTSTVFANGGTSDALAANFPGGSFSQGTASYTPTSGIATGAIASSEGGLYMATGDLSGLKVSSTESQSIIYGGADINLAASSNISENAVIQAYIGPSYRYLGQHNTTTISATAPALTNPTYSDLSMPTYTDTRTEDLNTNYFGGLGGFNYTTKVKDNLSLTLGVSAGVYSAWADLTGSETFGLGGGSCVTSCNPSTSPLVPQQTVNNANGVSGTWNGMAFSGGLSGAVTMAMNDKTSVSLGGSVDYLSAVPVATHTSGVSVTGGGTTGAASAAGPGTGAATTITTAGMATYGLTLSFNGHF